MTPHTISEKELNSEKWDKARAMCERYGYDIHEIAAKLAKFRTDRAEARAQALREYTASQPAAAAPAPATLVHFNRVRQYWNAKAQRWTRSDIVYIGRAMPHVELPASPFGNPFRIDKDTDETRADAIEMYAEWITSEAQRPLLQQLDNLRGKTLVCWCKSARPGKPSYACHGDVLLQLMADQPTYADEPDDETETY